MALVPVARTPLWQLAQVPATTPAWSKPLAGRQPLVPWQLSQLAVVTMCACGLPPACWPLWQEAHVPRETPAWFMRAPVKVRVVWQLSQVCVLTMWLALLTTLPRASRAPALPLL